MERLLRAGDEAAARAYARRLAGVFGPDAWLSLELHTPDDEAVQPKEVTHLIQCGVLDSRAALLAEFEGMGQTGGAL